MGGVSDEAAVANAGDAPEDASDDVGIAGGEGASDDAGIVGGEDASDDVRVAVA